MRIKKLVIENFRNHELSTIDTDAAFLVFRGSNFAGKSSIAQAISMALTPSTMGLSMDGKGYLTKVRRGATKAVLTADIQGKVHLVQRTVTLHTNTSGRTELSKCLDDPEWHTGPFEKQLDNMRAALSVALNTDRFLTMDEKEQKSLLAKLALPKQYDFAADTVASVNKYLGDGTVDFGGDPFATIEKAYKLLYKERENVNRQVKDFVVPERLPEGPLGHGAVDSLNFSLNEARNKQKKLSAERDELISKNNEDNVKRTRLQERVMALAEKIKEEQERVKAIEKRMLSEAKLKESANTASGKDAVEKLDQERQKVLTTITIKKSKVETYGKVAGASGEECPTCHQTIDGDTIAELHAAAVKELAAAQARDTEILQQMRTYGDVAGAAKAVADHNTAVSEKEAIYTVIAEKTKLMEAAQTEANKIPTHTDVLIPFVKPLDEVDAEITSILAKLQPAMAAEERKKEIAAKTEQLKALTAKAASVDALVTIFGKDGIKAKLLKEHVGGFVDRMNVVMTAFGYKVALEIEPDFIFNVTDATGVTTPAKELSGSESLMWLVALQAAVSKAAGIGIVVADKLDTFLPSQRSKINRILYTLATDGTLDQVIAIMSDESETVPKLPNSAFFLVEAGTVRRLG